MEREAIKALFDASYKVEKALCALPYSDAIAAMGHLNEMRDLVAEQLPGFEYVECQHCNEGKGVDEMTDCGDELICTDCFEDFQKTTAA